MIKSVIAPVQAWILLQGKCVGCGRSLSLASKFERGDNTQKVVCKCRRIFIFDKRTGRFHRATKKEAGHEK
jgi:hypothetical protein